MASGVYKLLNLTIYRSFPVNQEQMAGRIIWIDVGIVLLWMGSQYTEQPIDIEGPIGIMICLFYIICGAISFVRTKNKQSPYK